MVLGGCKRVREVIGSLSGSVKVRNNGLLSQAGKGLTTSSVGNWKFVIGRLERECSFFE